MLTCLLSETGVSPSPVFALREAWMERVPSTNSTLIESRFTPGSSART
jgi:hypothetical protein